MIDINKYQIEAIKQNLPVRQVLEAACTTLKDSRKQLQSELVSLNSLAVEGGKRKKEAKLQLILSNILIPIGGIVLFLFLDYQLANSANKQLYENRSITYFMPSFGNEIVNIHKKIEMWIIWICVGVSVVGLIIANIKAISARPKGNMLQAMQKHTEVKLKEQKIGNEIDELEAILKESKT